MSDEPIPTPRPGVVTSNGMAVILDALAEHVELHLDAVWTASSAHQWRPANDRAPFAREKREAVLQSGPHGRWDGDEIDRALMYGTLGLAVSTQLLDGMISCLRSRQAIFTLAPLARSVIERLGLVGWLLHTGQDMRETWSIRDRVARLLLVEISDGAHHLRAAKSLSSPAEIQKLTERATNRKALVNLLFQPHEISKTNRGDLIIRTNQMPGVSNLNSNIGAGLGLNWNHDGLYRVLSNLTHPTYAPLVPLLRSAGPQGTHWEVNEPAFLARIVRAGLLGYSYTWQLLTTYLGYPTHAIHALRVSYDDDERLQGL